MFTTVGASGRTSDGGPSWVPIRFYTEVVDTDPAGLNDSPPEGYYTVFDDLLISSDTELSIWFTTGGDPFGRQYLAANSTAQVTLRAGFSNPVPSNDETAINLSIAGNVSIFGNYHYELIPE